MTDTRAIDETAARWHARAMTGELSPQDAQRLDAWLAEDPRHRLAYADMVAAAYALLQVHASASTERRAARRWTLWLAAAAPALLLIAVVQMPHAWQNWRSDVHTAIGAVQTQRLPDGSTL
ncbi:MAG TPA: DUF4880 domain-containing protein, partial [Rudaea sp.]|nr:DUF4880 domain-containing protein [Rudaea sp.]